MHVCTGKSTIAFTTTGVFIDFVLSVLSLTANFSSFDCTF